MPLYAYRLKGVRGDSWRIFRVEIEWLSGKLRKLSHLIPPLPKTNRGKTYLDWDKGMKLNDFIALICSQAGLEKYNFNQLKIRSSKPDMKIISKNTSENFELEQKFPSQIDIFAELARRKSV
jgi:hypothetical protein